MASLNPIHLLISTLTLVLWATPPTHAQTTPSQPADQTTNQIDQADQWTAPPLPLTRSTLMGFTGFPYDATLQALNESNAFINLHGDLIAIHNDHGVPWPEALEGNDNYSPSLIGDITRSRNAITKGKKIYVAATAQSNLRNDQLALYWGQTDNMALPLEWADKPINDPDVITAYLNWCRYLIAQLNPDYFAYGIESNGGFNSINDPRFIRFKNFLQGVYPTLKAEYPDLPIFLSVQTSNTQADGPAFFEMTAALLNYSDWVGISSYPYFRWDINSPIGITTAGNPNEIPDNLLSDIRNLAPDKPVAITETGYPAQDLIIDALGINQPATQQWQAMYINQLMRQLEAFDARFLIWFLHRDHDLLNDRLFPNGDAGPLFLIWRDTGLLDENGTARQGLRTWDQWRRVPTTNQGSIQSTSTNRTQQTKRFLAQINNADPRADLNHDGRSDWQDVQQFFFSK